MKKTTKHRRFKEVTPTKELASQFQTPHDVAIRMASMLPHSVDIVLEPTPGQGTLKWAVKEIRPAATIVAPRNYFTMPKQRFDAVIMNPPFSEKYCYKVPKGYKHKGMSVGYQILLECMEMSNYVVALMPWFTIIDSDVRLRKFIEYGLVSVTALPRKTFGYSRIQTCILVLRKGFMGTTEFKTF